MGCLLLPRPLEVRPSLPFLILSFLDFFTARGLLIYLPQNRSWGRKAGVGPLMLRGMPRNWQRWITNMKKRWEVLNHTFGHGLRLDAVPRALPKDYACVESLHQSCDEIIGETLVLLYYEHFCIKHSNLTSF